MLNIYAILIIITLIFSLLTFFIIYLTVFLNKKKMVFRQELLTAQLEIQEQTFHNISEELHDNIAQLASLVKLQLKTIDVHDIEKTKEQLISTVDTTNQLIKEIRALSAGLNGDKILENGLVSAVEKEAERLNKIGVFETKLQLQPGLQFMDTERSLILFRMIQEILNNAIKHSNCHEINIIMESPMDQGLLIIIKDDGQGFIINERMLRKGSGLLNLQNRAGIIKAQMNIDSIPENGTTITIRLPAAF